MLDTDWERLEALFHEAVDLDTARRCAFLEAACADRPELGDRVEEMVRALGSGEDPISEAVAAAAQEYEQAGAPSLVGARLGPYRVVAEVGRGGMGSVYRAVRDDGEYEADVAVKVIRGAAVDEALFLRFQAERRILAGLRHPNIASLLDAGTTPDGLPYMVMELVEGTPITRYCDDRRLSLDDRLNLFLQVCDAVHFSHRNLVVHRDLKPSNILVTDDGVPKLVDFGVAKLLEEGLGDEMTQTMAHQAVLTPAYASPEQLANEPVTVATDVYGLGLVLYELLAGRRAQRFTSRSPADLDRVIRQVDPPTLRSAALEAGLEEVARLRHCSPRRLARTLSGDIATVVAKAVRKEPARRYTSVVEFAQDVEAAARGRPVSARPDTLGYRLARFASRNRAGVLGGGVLAATVVVLMTLIVVQAREARRERDLAERRRAVAAEVSDFLVQAFGTAGAPLEREISPAQVLAAGEGRLASLMDRPGVRAGLMDALGRLYLDLGLTDAAEAKLVGALELRRDLFGEDDADYGASLAAVGRLRLSQGAYDAAARSYARAAAVLEGALGAAHEEAVAARLGLARVLGAQGDYEAADSLYATLVTVGPPGSPDPTRAEVLANQAELLRSRGIVGAARERAEEALVLRRALLPDDHPDVAYSTVQVERLTPAPASGPLAARPEERHRAPIPTPFDVVAGDFDGDGDVDLLWSHREGGLNIGYRGAGPEGRLFQHPDASPPVPWEAFEPLAGDFNGDGRDDLAFNARGYANHMYVCLSGPDGGFDFAPLWTHPVGSPEAPTWAALSVAVLDADGDGMDDLVWYHGPRMMAWMGRSMGDGSFGASEPTPLVRPEGSLPPSVVGQTRDWARFPAGDAPRVLAADVDGDGVEELVWNWLEDRNEAWMVRWRAPEFQAVGPAVRREVGNIFLRQGAWHYYRVLAGDVDGDLRDDVVWVDPATPFPPADVDKRVYVGRSRSTRSRLDLTPEGPFQDGLLGEVRAPLDVRLGDVNGDGRADLVWNRRTPSGENRVWVTLGRANGRFDRAPAPLLHPAGPRWDAAVFLVADTDGDGRDELVWNIPGAVNRTYRVVWREEAPGA